MDCVFCGRDFFQISKNHRYCSARCRIRRFNKDVPDKIHGKKLCLNCGKEFESRYSKAKFCCAPCHWKFANANRPTTKEVDRECPICNSLFKPMQKRGVGRMCCSDECTIIWRKQYKPNHLERVAKRKQHLEDLKEYGRSDRKMNPDKYADMALRKKYGISLDQYNEMFGIQDGLCAICKKPEKEVDIKTGKPRRLALDHHHDSGKIRKLLCSNCNLGIGNFGEDIEALKSAIDYLASHQGD